MPELIWPGKGIQPLIPAPLVTDSVVYPQGYGYPKTTPECRLIHGDNLSVMATMLPEFEGRVNLIYADPPFFTNRKFSARIGRGEDSRNPMEWKLADGYHDRWDDLDSYLEFLHQRLLVMYRLLAPDGTLYLHLDWHANSYVRLLLDEIFGADRLLNEIIWVYHGPSPITRGFNRKHDVILAYTKSDRYVFNADAVREPYHQNTVATFASSRKAGFGKIPNLARGKVPEDWWYFPVVARLHSERTGYPTQKPEGLLERIILASSNPGDIVADFFCGSGTTPVVAVRHARKFLACDESFRSIHTARKRLSGHQAVFTLEHDANLPYLFSPAPKTTTASIKPGTMTLGSRLNLDYWEIDPAWDGKIFRSAAQAVRPMRSGEISKALNIKTGSTACIRLVTASGKQYQLHV